MTITADDFALFYREVYGLFPFPWQSDLVAQVLRDAAWPDLVDVPTGLGKTALIDICVFVTAATAATIGSSRLGRRRIFFVVDRRIVVDEAYERARTLSDALAKAPEGSTASRVAAALRSLSPHLDVPLTVPPPYPQPRLDRKLLRVTRMRGGVTWDAAWLDRPDVCGVVVGTVDQVGSRVLFRGYGVSDRRKPIDAALVGMDSLILVDEAHLAVAMTATLGAAQHRDRGDIGVPKATVVRLTATPGPTTERTYSIDIDAHRGNEEAWKRLSAPKRLLLHASDPKSIADELARQAMGCVADGFDTVMVVCNTVERARAVHEALRVATTRKKDPLVAEVDLLIGRSRPADRDILAARLLRRFGIGRLREPGIPGVLVATQTVEVGVNLDVDALVTETAPWDSLVQRLGRLNRLGESPAEAKAVVVHDGADSALYGPARQATWEALQAAGGDTGLDASSLACRELALELGDDTRSESPPIPILTTPVLDAWARTAPTPMPDPPTGPYLHGLGPELATVGIAWRDGLLVEDPIADDVERSDSEIDVELSMLPVLAAEVVEVPIHAVRRWLAGEAPVPISDLDNDDPGSTLPGRPHRSPFRALAWRGGLSDTSTGDSRVSSGAWTWIDAGAIRPGDLLVVPSERGGLDDYGWAPNSQAGVHDVAEVVRFAEDAESGRGRLRIDDLTSTRLGLGDGWRDRLSRCRRSLAGSMGDESIGEPVEDVLAEAVTALLAENDGFSADERLPGTAWTLRSLKRLAEWLPGAVVTQIPAGEDLGSDRFLLVKPRGSGGIDRDDEQPECSSLGLAPITVRVHHQNVGDRARQMADSLGIAPAVATAVEAAARWHDLGKAEGRFQSMLSGGDTFDALLLEEPLAKSGLDPTDRAAFIRARLRSGLPPGARHEAWSSALVSRYLGDVSPERVDRDLVVHLVASHHGHARPWSPFVIDDNPRDFVHVVEGGLLGSHAKITIDTADTVDFDHPRRFAILNHRYGRWGLALLESIVRCADMTVSAEGS